MEPIILKGSIKIIGKKCRTRAEMFFLTDVGDIIDLSVQVKAAGRNKSTYATYINCINRRTKEQTDLSFNQIANILDCFDYINIDNDLGALTNCAEEREG